MATVAYAGANGTNGRFASRIGWIDWGDGFSLAAGASQNLNITLTDGEYISFTVTNTITGGTGIPFPSSPIQTWSGSGLGFGGYTGFSASARPAIYSSQSGANNSRMDFSNITVKTSSTGSSISNYIMIFADSESLGPSSAGEFLNFTTNGGGFQTICFCSNSMGGANPTVTGLGTTTLSLAGNSTGAAAWVGMSTNPTTASAAYGGFNGFAIGFAVTKIILKQNLLNRVSYSDQFNIIISGTPTTTVATTGNNYGIQAGTTIPSYVIAGNTYTINKTMAAGSDSILGNYKTTVTSTNGNTIDGTSVTNLNGIGKTITVTVGDFITSTIETTFTIPNVSISKSVNINYLDINPTTLVYTLTVSNNGSLQAINTILKDTIPSGTTFVSNSLIVNGTSTVTSPTLVNIGTIAGGTSVTLSFSVLSPNTIPSINPIVNSASATFTGADLGGANSNSTSTLVSTSFVNSIKSVIPYANLYTTLTYTIPLIISGNTTPNVVFIDTLPSGVNYIGYTFKLNGVIISNANLSSGISLGTLPIGVNTITFNACITTLPSSNSIINQASITYKYTTDPSLPNNVFKSITTNSTQTIVNTPIINATKTCDKVYVTFADILTYTIIVTNTGSVSANNLVLKDTLPVGISYVNNTLTVNGVSNSGTPSSISIGTLPSGSVTTITFNAKVL